MSIATTHISPEQADAVIDHFDRSWLRAFEHGYTICRLHAQPTPLDPETVMETQDRTPKLTDFAAIAHVHLPEGVEPDGFALCQTPEGIRLRPVTGEPEHLGGTLPELVLCPWERGHIQMTGWNAKAFARKVADGTAWYADASEADAESVRRLSEVAPC